MISRTRLAHANRHAKRRYSAIRARWREMGGLWQRFRKLTKGCSAPCCGNPRRWYGQATRQEQRNEEEQG